jgi:transcriptional regulator with XRE-family HTH domain
VPIKPLSDEAAQEFGRRLLKARKRRGMTQNELADRAETSRESISRWERGLNNDSRKDTADLSMSALAALSVALDMLISVDQRRPGEIVIEFIERG